MIQFLKMVKVKKKKKKYYEELYAQKCDDFLERYKLPRLPQGEIR